MAKTVSFAYLCLIAPFFLHSHLTLALPSPIRPRYGSKAPLLELCVDTDASLAPVNVAVSVMPGLPRCWSYSPFPSNSRSSSAAVPTSAQASQPTLTIIIPAVGGNIPQLAPQAVEPTNSAEVQANGGQGTRGQDRTDRGGEKETFRTISVAPGPQYATPTMPILSGKTTAYVPPLESGASSSVPRVVDQPSETTSIRDTPSQAILPLGARVALGIAIPVALTGIVALLWMLYRRHSRHSIDVTTDEATGFGTGAEQKRVYFPPPYPPPGNIQGPGADPEKMDVFMLPVARLPFQTSKSSSEVTSAPPPSVSGHTRQPSLDAHEPITEAPGFAPIDRAPLACAQPSLVRKGVVNFSRPLKAFKSPTSTPAVKMPPTPKLTPKTPNFSLSLPRTTVHYPGNRQVVATPGSYQAPTIMKRRFSPQGVILYSTGDLAPSPKENHPDPGGQSITSESIIAAYETNTEPSTPKKRLTSFKADLSPSRWLGGRTTLSPIISIFSPKLGSSASPEVTKTLIKPLHLRSKKPIKPPPATLSRASRVDDNDPGFSQFIQGFIANNEAYHAKRTRAIQEAKEKENLPVYDENSSSGLGSLLPPLSLGLSLTAGSSTSTLPSLMSDTESAFEVDRKI